MKEILICGLRDIETLCAVENFLDDDYKIVGYADITAGNNYLTWNGGGRQPFHTLRDIKGMSFDYAVFPFFDNTQLNDLAVRFRKCGCNQNIIVPVILRPYSPEKHCRDMISAINDADEDYFGIFSGLSYSLSGIDNERLNRKFFNISWGGRDMYYNLKLLEYAFKIGKLSNVKVAFLVFPYYYFDYDQSRSYAQYESGQMFGVHELNDFHNTDKIEDKRYEVQNYIMNYRMMNGKNVQLTLPDNRVVTARLETDLKLSLKTYKFFRLR